MCKHINQLIGKNLKITYIASIKKEHKTLHEDKKIAEEFNN